MNDLDTMKTQATLAKDIIAMNDEGHSAAAILEYVTSEGLEFCDASWLVSRVLKLSHEAQLDMEEAYN
jgi:hypothetical protein